MKTSDIINHKPVFVFQVDTNNRNIFTGEVSPGDDWKIPYGPKMDVADAIRRLHSYLDETGRVFGVKRLQWHLADLNSFIQKHQDLVMVGHTQQQDGRFSLFVVVG